jgi:hypothetical protein
MKLINQRLDDLLRGELVRDEIDLGIIILVNLNRVLLTEQERAQDRKKPSSNSSSPRFRQQSA